jgi:glycosyltransferase involved in cell wall biosynthesis
MNYQPLVSIVMNCYNGEKYLREAIESVYAQTYDNWEIIFWDNFSTDRSAEIAKSYDKRLKYYCGVDNVPLGAARNKALEKSNGEYISFLDVDDLWLSEKLELQVQKMKDEPKAVVCYSDGYDMYEGKKSKKKFSSHKNIKFHKGYIFDKLILSNFINWQTVLINKILSGDNLYFNEELTYSEDHEILLRLSLCGEIIFLKDPIVYYRLHENNMSHNYKLILIENEKIFKLFNKEIMARKININKAKARIYCSIIIKLIEQHGDYKYFSKYLIKYPNFQNIIIYILIKLNLTGLLNLTANVKNLVR